MQPRSHRFDRYVCYVDATGVKQRETATTEQRYSFVTGRLQAKGLAWWIERKYYSL